MDEKNAAKEITRGASRSACGGSHMPSLLRKRVLGLTWRVRDAALSADSKIRRILSVLASGKALNRFQALGYHDSVLNSTISKIEDKGIRVSRKEEVVRGFEGNDVHCMRYWLTPDQAQRAHELLGHATGRPGQPDASQPHHAPRTREEIDAAARAYAAASGR